MIGKAKEKETELLKKEYLRLKKELDEIKRKNLDKKRS